MYISRAEYRALGLLHRWNAWAVGVLAASGVLLYAEPLRGLIAPVRVPLKYLHIGCGIGLAVYAAATGSQWGRFLVRRGLHAGRRLNTVLTVTWLAAWTASGLLMWLRGRVPYGLSNLATTAHDWLTWLFLPWVAGHIAFRLVRVRRPATQGRTELAAWLGAPATRRGLLYSSAAVVGLGIVARWLTTDRPGAEPADPGTVPGGGMKGRFRLYFINNTIPTFDPAAWRLKVGDKTYTWDDVQALPRTTMVRDFHCVTGWSVFDITWEGVRLRALLDHAGVPRAGTVIFHSGDGAYTDALTWAQAAHPDVMLAYTIDGKPLPRMQGGPLRLVVPNMYGYKSVKWVEGITFASAPDYEGYWEQRGYPADAFLEKADVHPDDT